MKKLYEICYGVEPTEEELALLEIHYQRLIDNGFTEKEAQKIMLNNKFNVDDLIFEDSLIITSDESIYYHYELQIHSKPGSFDPVTMEVIKRPYYLEMKYRYTMNQLINNRNMYVKRQDVYEYMTFNQIETLNTTYFAYDTIQKTVKEEIGTIQLDTKENK